MSLSIPCKSKEYFTLTNILEKIKKSNIIIAVNSIPVYHHFMQWPVLKHLIKGEKHPPIKQQCLPHLEQPRGHLPCGDEYVQQHVGNI